MIRRLSFECPRCSSTNGGRILLQQEDVDTAYCDDCGYNHYYLYRKENGQYLKIEEHKDLDYDNIQCIEREVNLPYGVSHILYSLVDRDVSSLESIESYDAFVKSIRNKPPDNALRVIVSRFIDGKVEQNTIYENPDSQEIEERNRQELRQLLGGQPQFE